METGSEIHQEPVLSQPEIAEKHTINPHTAVLMWKLRQDYIYSVDIAFNSKTLIASVWNFRVIYQRDISTGNFRVISIAKLLWDYSVAPRAYYIEQASILSQDMT